MHHFAEKWEKNHKNDANSYENVDGKLVPVNRPCDWCGEIVDMGYIHSECRNEEASFYLDILY